MSTLRGYPLRPAGGLVRAATWTDLVDGTGSSPDRFPRQVMSVLTVDMERFSRPEHDDAVQVRLRARLYRALLETLDRLETPDPPGRPGRLPGGAADCEVYDRGDGAIVLIPSTITLTRAVSVVVGQLPRMLRTANAGHRDRIRIRGAIHTGWVTHDPYGVSGTVLNQVCQLQDSRAMRLRLAHAGGDLVVALSGSVFAGAVEHDGWVPPPPGLEPMVVDTKLARVPVWVYAPGPTPP